MRLSGWPGIPSTADFTAHVVSTDVEDIGSFETSDPQINRLQENIWWSQVANTVAIPTDCPQREKAGWTGDVTVYSPTMCFLRDEEAFLTKWLRNCRADQEDDGEIPTVVPFLECYRQMGPYYGLDTSCGWGDVIVALPWYLYKAYGNREVLEENYPAMKKWMGYVRHCAETEMPEGYEGFDEEKKARQKYLWNTGFHYGDWLVPSMVLNVLALRDYMITVGKKYAPHIRKFNIESNTVYGSRRMGNENIGRRRCDYRFSLCMAVGILGKTDEGRYDFNSYDRSSYDALASLPE